MNLRIETAKEENVPQILELMREFAEYENLLDYVEATEERLKIALFGDGKTAEAIVAFDKDAPVGYAVFYPNFATFRGQRGFYLEDIFVKKEFHARGVGEMLLKHLAREGARRGYERIDFQVLEWNAPAIRFYEKWGAHRDDEERHFKFTDEAFRKLAS